MDIKASSASSEVFQPEALSAQALSAFADKYDQNPVNRVVESAVMSVGIDAAAQRPEVVKRHRFVFTHTCKQGEATSQKKSGRCWYFASLNALRGPIIKALEVENFEFSQTHLYFYDKLEKANAFLEHMIRLADRPIGDRELDVHLDLTSFDGGYWDYFVELCLKYGLLPKSEGPETFHSQDSYMFTKQMDHRLKRTAARIRQAHRQGASLAELREFKQDCLAEIYNIAVKCLGRPVERFTYRYENKDKKEVVLPEMTPLEFFEKYVGREALLRRITVCADPRPEMPVGKRLQLENSHNVVGGTDVTALNVPMEHLAEAMKASILDGEPFWFACDVGKDIDRKKGLLDESLYNYDEVLTPIGDFSKADRFTLRYSAATHAMNLTGVSLDDQGNPLYWKVENSWGEDLGRKGTFSMSHPWMLAYTYEAILDRKYLDEKYLKGLDEEPIRLPIWEPFGRLLQVQGEDQA